MQASTSFDSRRSMCLKTWGDGKYHDGNDNRIYLPDVTPEGSWTARHATERYGVCEHIPGATPSQSHMRVYTKLKMSVKLSDMVAKNEEHEAHAAKFDTPWKIVSACIVERLPVIMPDVEPWRVRIVHSFVYIYIACLV
jgi:hypothetical protein